MLLHFLIENLEILCKKNVGHQKTEFPFEYSMVLLALIQTYKECF